MLQIELSSEEQEVLGQILQHSLATLEIEIRHTDHREFKQLLKHRRDVITGLAAKVPQPTSASA